MTELKTSKRLLSLDVYRGITIAGMILVNNPGSWGNIYTPLGHAEWNGLTPTDLVFPFFVLIMGISMYISYSKFNFAFSTNTFIKLLRRSSLIFLIGLFLHWCSLFLRGYHNLSANEELSFFQVIGQAAWNFENIRILGVLPRLAIIAFCGSMIILLVNHKFIPWIIGITLILYWVIIGLTDSYMPSEDNIVAVIDRLIIGTNHMYTDHFSDGTKLKLDPEGLFSTIPAIAHVLIGFLIGKIVMQNPDRNEAIRKIMIAGALLLFAGFLMNYGFPINKKIWTSSFVLVTCGFGSLLFGVLIWIIDVKGKRGWIITFFNSFGVNPMFIYILAFFLSVLTAYIGFTYNGEWIAFKTFFYRHIIESIFSGKLASLVFAILFVSANWVVGHILYKKKIYIKL
ncbi:MAG: DUF5009 domain-containing protein [Thalassobius sp.]|nr:DUF5009 domain-containing protein [Thalassovita sp.]